MILFSFSVPFGYKLKKIKSAEFYILHFFYPNSKPAAWGEMNVY